MLPKGLWQLRTLVAFAALCAVHGVVRAQELRDAARAAAAAVEDLPFPEPRTAGARRADVAKPERSRDAHRSLELPEALADVGPAGIGNADIQEMVGAEFSDSTIIAVINANDVQFDLSPRALVALKGAGVSEHVIEAMIAAEAAKEPAAVPEPTSAELAETQASLEYARLTTMIEQLAAKQEAAAKRGARPSRPPRAPIRRRASG